MEQELPAGCIFIYSNGFTAMQLTVVGDPILEYSINPNIWHLENIKSLDEHLLLNIMFHKFN